MGIRTDLAMEAKALWEKSAGKTTKLAGVRARERERDGFAVTVSYTHLTLPTIEDV